MKNVKQDTKSPVIILTEEREGGKTTLLKKVSFLLKKENIPLRGFYAEGYFKNNRRSHFDLTDVHSGKSQLLCKRDEAAGEGFSFVNKTVEKGTELLTPTDKPAVYIIDEVGKYELKGQIWHKPLQKLLETQHHVLLVTVRKSFLEEVLHHFGIEPQRVFTLDNSAEEIAGAVKKLFLRVKQPQ